MENRSTTIYLDNAATTPVHPKVAEAMYPYFTEFYGNPSSIHQIGKKAQGAVERARRIIADSLHCEPSEIVFTSGGTESDNLALRGVLNASDRTELITSNAEHHAIGHTAQDLRQTGTEVSVLPVTDEGVVDYAQLEKKANENTALISLMHVNNETGSVTDLERVTEIGLKTGALTHSDAVQSYTKFGLDTQKLPIDLLSLASHKINGPKGVGALFVRKGTPVHGVQTGGSQEKKRRGGTLNVPGIVGFGEAVRIAMDEQTERLNHLRSLKEKLSELLDETFGDKLIRNSPDESSPHILNVAFREELNIDGQLLLMKLDMEGLCVSSGSACSAGTITPSHVLKSIGRSDHLASSAIRLSLGYQNTEAEIVSAVEILEKVYTSLLSADNLI